MRNEDVSDKKMLMLATSEDDRLSLLRREEASLEVSVWLYVGDHGSGGDPENSWLLRQSIGIRKLIEDAGLSRFQTRLQRLGGAGDQVGAVLPKEPQRDSLDSTPWIARSGSGGQANTKSRRR
jgi:hypothetical protein